MKHLFLDTNIVIDMLADRKPFSIAASTIFEAAEKKKIKLSISALSFTTIYFILEKTIAKKQLKLSLRDLTELCNVSSVDQSTISKALTSEFADFEDAVQYYSALGEPKVDFLVTRDIKDYKSAKISVRTPDEILELL